MALPAGHQGKIEPLPVMKLTPVVADPCVAHPRARIDYDKDFSPEPDFQSGRGTP